MWSTLSGSILDVNLTNRVYEKLAASFVANANELTLDATTTEFIGPGAAPLEIHWRGDGQGWVVAEPDIRIPAGDADNSFFDLPKLLWPDRYPPLAGICGLGQQTVILDTAACRLLGNGRAALVTAELDHEHGVIRSYRSEDEDGVTLRTVVLSYPTGPGPEN
ncbi:MAG: hypothetical protein M3Y42_03200 [Actinomycetota bacterium]|nr:hypothetical protein [Actinomycetota bacterium]MDQ2955955.1 hypothetical protein [Actinomycetota bacterium]